MVKVKALEWKEGPFATYTYYAESVLGEWASWEIQGRAYYRSPERAAGRPEGQTIEEAQTAAHADYESRILSALEEE